MSDHDHDVELPPLPEALIHAADAGCEEPRLIINRRDLLGMSAGLFAWAHMPRHAEAAGTEPRLLVVILGGGMDGLHVAPPLNDPFYSALRGSIALDLARIPKLSAEFGINPAMPKFRDMFARGEASLVQAIAPPLQIGSHFEGLYNIESGMPGGRTASSTTGWLNRLLLKLPVGAAVRTDMMHIGPTPLILSGPAPVISWSPGIPPLSPAVDARVAKVYSSTSPPLSDLLQRGLMANALATGTASSASQVTARTSAMQRAFRGAARLMSAATGPRVAVLKIDGWDTHVGQTNLLSTKLADLDSSLDDFRLEMGASWATTAVVCVTEMGRTAAVNGNGGTDHGAASVAFLAGGAVAGGRIWGEWPGLAKNNLAMNGRALRATTDMRAVFKGLLADHLGVPRCILDTDIFPESAAVAPLNALLRNPVKPSDSQITAACSPPASMAASTSAAAAAMAMAGSAAAPAAAGPARLATPLARFRQSNGAG